MTILHLDNISINFSGSNKPALQNIQYRFNQGDFVILLGSNGSGKSTLLKLLQKQLRPQTGMVHIHNDKNFKISSLTQNCSDSLFTSLTVYENYLLVRMQQPVKTRRSKQKRFLMQYLSDFNPNLIYKLDSTITQLSGGEKQALALALCLLNNPSLLLLDEHTSALDPKTSRQIMMLTQKMISRNGITCILTTHDMDIALDYGNRILMLNEGRILNTFDKHDKAMLSKEQLVKCYYSERSASIGSSRAAVYAG